jgi:enoyl-CoA hydratase/carnithine racemase
MEESIRLRKDGELARVFMNRPQASNAFDLDMLRRFTETLISLAADAPVRAVVITGEGKAFCPDGDLRWASQFPQGLRAVF